MDYNLPDYNPPPEFGPFIKQFIKDNHTSKYAIAAATHITRKTLDRWESGAKWIQYGTLKVFASHFGLTLDQFFAKFEAYRQSVMPAVQAANHPLSNDATFPSASSDRTEAVAPSHVEPILVSDTGIPHLFDHFRGRDDLLTKLKDLLCGDKRIRSIALYGTPGVGKTAMAMALAHDPTVQQYFHGGILWAGLGASPDIERIQRRWRNLLHVQDIEAETMQLAIGSQPLLLVLDDVWTIQHAATFFQLGSYNPSCRYLITAISQSLADELSENHSFKVPELTSAQGLEVLQQLAPTIVQAEKEAAHTLIEAVGGLPLAIWLLGMHLESQANRQQPRRIQEALELIQNYEKRLELERFTPDLKAFPNLEVRGTISLEAVIGVRYEALDAKAQQMLRALSIFPAKPNTFSENAASAVATSSGQAFREHLVDVGLVEDVKDDRYTLHQTIRDFAHRKLTKEQGENEAANERLAHFFADYVKRYDVQSVDEANINLALAWARDHEQDELYLELAAGMQYFWRDHWRVTDSIGHLHRGFLTAIATYEETKDPQRLRNMMEIACNYGSTLLVANRLAETKHVFETILATARSATPDRLSEGIALFNLGVVALRQKDLEEARAKLEESRHIRQEEQYQDEWPLDFVTFCQIAHSRRQLEILKDHFERAIAIDRAVQNRRGEGVDHFSLGNIDLIQENYEAALRSYQACLAVVDEFQEKVSGGVAPARWRDTLLVARGTVLSVLCEVSLLLGNLDSAQNYLQQSMDIIKEVQQWREYTINLLYSARLALANGQKEDASRYCLEALMAAREGQNQQGEADALDCLAKIAVFDGELDQAEEFHRRGLKLYEAVESAPYIASSRLQLGQLLIKRGKREEGCAMLSEAIQWYSDMEMKDNNVMQEIAEQFRDMCRDYLSFP